MLLLVCSRKGVNAFYFVELFLYFLKRVTSKTVALSEIDLSNIGKVIIFHTLVEKLKF